MQTQLIGHYNVANLLGGSAACARSASRLADAAAACAPLTPVPGRMQRARPAARRAEVVVDYAHTPDALEKALAALRPFASDAAASSGASSAAAAIATRPSGR